LCSDDSSTEEGNVNLARTPRILLDSSEIATSATRTRENAYHATSDSERREEQRLSSTTPGTSDFEKEPFFLSASTSPTQVSIIIDDETRQSRKLLLSRDNRPYDNVKRDPNGEDKERP
jgi:tmRNA-binding protein